MQNSSVAVIEQAIPSPTATQLTLSKAFSKNMVLQREENCRIWGFSTDPDGSVVTAEINGVKGSGVVEDGRWEVMLPPMEANTTPGNLIVRGAGDCYQVVTNVLIGDVWFTNGQSNMDYNMEIVKNWETEKSKIKSSDHIRYFYQNKYALYRDAECRNRKYPEYIENEREDVLEMIGWQPMSSINTSAMSAIGYYFAKAIIDATENQIPIGIVMVSSGGSTLNQLTPANVNLKYGFTSDKNDSSYIYNNFMAPFEPMAMKGMLFYQGESDSYYLEGGDRSQIDTYAQRVADYVAELRKRCGNTKNKNFPFYFVQLASHPDYDHFHIRELRVAQHRSAALIPNSAVITAMDLGVSQEDLEAGADWMHPWDKAPLAERLASVALKELYGREGERCPIAVDCAFNGNDAIVTFTDVGSGLKTADGGALKGFEVYDGENWTAAQAVIESKNTVRVKGAKEGVRYGYFDMAPLTRANLINSRDYACGTFFYEK